MMVFTIMNYFVNNNVIYKIQSRLSIQNVYENSWMNLKYKTVHCHPSKVWVFVSFKTARMPYSL